MYSRIKIGQNDKRKAVKRFIYTNTFAYVFLLSGIVNFLFTQNPGSLVRREYVSDKRTWARSFAGENPRSDNTNSSRPKKHPEMDFPGVQFPLLGLKM